MRTESQAVRELREAMYSRDKLERLSLENVRIERAAESVLTELAACQAERSEDKRYIEELCADLCKMEDVLGFKHDCTDEDGAFVPTIGPWLERVRDLIAAEGELGDVKAERNAAQAACAEMRDVLSETSLPGWRLNLEWMHRRGHALSTDCGRGYVSAAELEPTIEWLRVIYEWCVSDCPSDLDGDEAKRQLARLEALKGAK